MLPNWNVSYPCWTEAVIPKEWTCLVSVSIHSRDSGRAFTRSRFRVIGGSFFDSSTGIRSTSIMWTIAEGGSQLGMKNSVHPGALVREDCLPPWACRLPRERGVWASAGRRCPGWSIKRRPSPSQWLTGCRRDSAPPRKCDWACNSRSISRVHMSWSTPSRSIASPPDDAAGTREHPRGKRLRHNSFPSRNLPVFPLYDLGGSADGFWRLSGGGGRSRRRPRPR